jgi:hypothetical protein
MKLFIIILVIVINRIEIAEVAKKLLTKIK